MEIESGKVFTHFQKDIQSDRVAIIYGDNTTGKSFVAGLIEEAFRAENIGVRSVSVKNRTAGGYEQSMIFGRESRQSTGETSVKVMNKAIDAAENDNKPSLVVLDEPDLGLSRKFSKALGIYLAQRVKEVEHLQLLLISHNSEFLESFMSSLHMEVTTCGINTEKTLSEWLSSDDVASVEELLGLRDLAHEKKRAIIQNEKKHEPKEKHFLF